MYIHQTYTLTKNIKKSMIIICVITLIYFVYYEEVVKSILTFVILILLITVQPTVKQLLITVQPTVKQNNEIPPTRYISENGDICSHPTHTMDPWYSDDGWGEN